MGTRDKRPTRNFYTCMKVPSTCVCRDGGIVKFSMMKKIVISIQMELKPAGLWVVVCQMDELFGNCVWSRLPRTIVCSGQAYPSLRHLPCIIALEYCLHKGSSTFNVQQRTRVTGRPAFSRESVNEPNKLNQLSPENRELQFLQLGKSSIGDSFVWI
jgi:hypothetical protein